MRSTLRALLALLAVLALAVGLTACGGDDEGQEENTAAEATPEGGSGTPEAGAAAQPIQRDEANAGKTFTVGSKNFTEQYILGEIYAQSLEAAGFEVKKQLDLGSEQIAFKALKNGRIDGYPEYTGTALTSFYRVKTDDVPRDKEESFTQLEEELQADKITALEQTPFENTYKVVSTKETAEKYGNLKTVSEVAEKAGTEARLSAFPECRQRTDCLVGLQNTYDWNPKFVSSPGQYNDLDKGQAEFTMGFSTDGPLATGKYITYEDDKGLYPPYFVSFLVGEQGMKTLGDSGREVLERVQEPLTNEVMQELNSRVALDKQEPEQVAKDYLTEAGFIGGGGS